MAKVINSPSAAFAIRANAKNLLFLVDNHRNLESRGLPKKNYEKRTLLDLSYSGRTPPPFLPSATSTIKPF